MVDMGMENELQNWVTQLRKGTLELCIMGLLSRGEVYAYDLVKQLSSNKSLVITEGTVYPLLSRLKAGGLLQSRLEESSSGPARKYYSLTEKGKNVAALMNAYWKQLAESVNAVLESEEPHA